METILRMPLLTVMSNSYLILGTYILSTAKVVGVQATGTGGDINRFGVLIKIRLLVDRLWDSTILAGYTISITNPNWVYI